MMRKCELCGSNLEFKVQGSTEGFFCNKCDWALVTTHISEIERDTKTYKLYLLAADSKNRDHVKAISQITSVNFLQANNLIKEKQALILKGEAATIQKAKVVLDHLLIDYKIEPFFPY